MAISPLPTPPSREDPTNFATRADAFLGALPTFQSEANALQVDVNTRQTTASTAATTATTQAGIATTQAGIATTQAGIATTQAGISTASATSASASWDLFDDRMLGAKASDPTLDNDGNPILTGALYFSTTVNRMKVYDGTAWQLAYVPAGDFVTGAASSQTNSIVLFDGTTGKLVKQASVGTSGQYLQSNGAGVAPSWITPPVPEIPQDNALLYYFMG
jgi:hypothetical protein